jgi:aldehyde oxidoreductase
MGQTGVKIGCGTGVCGACSIYSTVDVIRSCTKKMKNVPDYSEITTIEGIGTPQNLHPLQQAWITYGGVQCGFCTPVFIVSSYGLLKENPNPTREEVREWFRVHKNVCRCTGYKPLVDSVMAAAKVMRGEATMKDIPNAFDGERSLRFISPADQQRLPRCATNQLRDDKKHKCLKVLAQLPMLSLGCTCQIINIARKRLKDARCHQDFYTRIVLGQTTLMPPLLPRPGPRDCPPFPVIPIKRSINAATVWPYVAADNRRACT